MTDERTDGGTTPVAELSETEFYTLIRTAFKDALLDVIGTVLLVGIGLLLFWAGVAGAVRAATGDSPGLALLGIGLATVGVYVAAAALEYVPSVFD